MKKFRKIISLIVAMVMVFAMTGQAFADETSYTIKINNTVSGHNYEAYQIFSGDLNMAGNVLSNVVWGNGVDTVTPVDNKTLIEAIRSINGFSTCTTAKDVAEQLAKEQDESETVDAFAAVVADYLIEDAVFNSDEIKNNDETETLYYTIDDLSAGYYFVKDADDSVTGTDDAYTKFILEVVADTEISPKSSVPTVTKKVQENVKSSAGYNDVADYNIGDDVPFRLTGTMPSRLSDYDTYTYIFHDTLADGLSYNLNAAVYVENNGSKVDITNEFSITELNGTLTVSCDNIKEIEGINAESKIVVEYTAELTNSAVLGLGDSANTNTVYLEYSNNPNGSGTGVTTEDKVIVFTYELDITKVAAESFNVESGEYATKLQNAKFKLYKMDGQNKSYVQVENNYVTGWTNSEAEATELVTGADGKIVIKGLDDETYYLKETAAPDGYNLLSGDVKIEIAATTDHASEWSGDASDALTGLTVTVDDGEEKDGTLTGGVVAINVENRAGATLPSTGGIGTTIFYAAGIILMAGAVFFVVRRKRA